MGMKTLNRDPADTKSTTAWCLPARFHEGRYCEARLAVSEASTIRGRETSLVECIPLPSAVALIVSENLFVPFETHVCSATISLSSSADRSSSSRLCRSTVARPFSINCSETLLIISSFKAGHVLVLVPIGDSHAFPLLEVSLLGLDVVDQDMDRLADKTFTQKSTVRTKTNEATHSFASLAQ